MSYSSVFSNSVIYIIQTKIMSLIISLIFLGLAAADYSRYEITSQNSTHLLDLSPN